MTPSILEKEHFLSFERNAEEQERILTLFTIYDGEAPWTFAIAWFWLRSPPWLGL